LQPRSLRDWVLLLALVAMWGSAFMFIKLGVATVPPATLVAGRILIGAVTLVLTLKHSLLKDIYWLNVASGDFPFLAPFPFWKSRPPIKG